MAFEKGNKVAKGGSRPGAGRKSRSIATQQKILAEIGMDLIRKKATEKLEKVIEAYFELAGGRDVNKWHEGKIVGQEFEVDGATLRHAIDRIWPAPQRIEMDLSEKGGKRVFRFELPQVEQSKDEQSGNGSKTQARAGGFTFSLSDS